MVTVALKRSPDENAGKALLSPIAIVAAAALAFAPAAFAQSQTLTGGFNNSTLDPGWQVGGTGYTPVLTSGNPDPVGQGWLQLTSSAGNEATYAVDTNSFASSNATITATFNYAAYNGTGADGITFFLANSAVPFAVGAYGGSLGYAQKTAAGTGGVSGGSNIDGMAGGYLGIGLDEYGNYSNGTEGRIGGINTPNLTPNAIAVRGPGSGLTGYDYLGGSGTLSTPISYPGQTTRPTGSETVTVEMILTATNQLTVYISFGGAAFTPEFTADLSGYARPNNLIMGFTGSTGGSTDVHQVQDVTLTSVVANLWTNTSGNSTWGAQGTANSDTNWANSPASNPAVGGDVLLDNTYVSSAQTIAVTGNQVIRNLQIDAPFSYTLNGGSLEFNGSSAIGPSGILLSQTHGYATQTVNSSLSADNAIEIQNNSSGSLVLGGAIALGANAVTFNGSGNVSSSGIISGTGGSVVQDGTGDTTFSGANTYTGGTTISAGTLTANNNTALGTGGVTLSGGTLASTGGNTITNAVALTGSAGLSGIKSGGALTETGGSYTLAMANATQSGALNLSNNSTAETLTVNAASGTSTISGVIANGGTGAGGLTKAGGGTLVLSGANTYTGATTVAAGTLQAGANNTISSNSALTLDAGTTLELNNFSDAVGSLTIAGAATVDLGSGGTNAFVFKGFTDAGGNTLTIDNYSGSNFLATTTAALAAALLNDIYFSGSGSGTVEAGATTTNDSVTSYRLTPNTTFTTWNGASGANSDYNTNANWVGGTAPGSGNAVKVDFTGATRLTPVLTANTTVNAVRFDTAASSFNLGGAFTYTLGGTVPSIIQESANAQTISTTTLALGANSIMDVSGAGALDITSKITGAFSLEKLSAGTLNLSGANTYSGGTTISAGVIGVSTSNTALGTGAVTVANGSTLQVNGGLTLANTLTIDGTGSVNGAIDSRPGSGNTATLSGAITLGGNSTISSDSGTLAIDDGIGGGGDLTFAGAGNTSVASAIATGTGNVFLDGTGAVTFTGANTYTGNTTVSSGTLNLSGSSTTVEGNLIMNGGATDETTSNQVSSTSSVSLNAGSYNLSNGVAQTFSGSFNTSSGTTLSLGTSGTGATLTLDGTGTDTLSGVITGAGSLVTSNTGTTVLAGANTYSGGTSVENVVNVTNSSGFGTGAVTVSGNGNVQIQNNVTLANSFNIDSTGTAFAGAFENVSGNNTISGAVTVSGASRIQSDSGTLTLTGPVGLGANSLDVGGNSNTAINGAITGTSASAITKDGTGTLSLGAANPSFAGSVTVTGGTLQTNVANAFTGTTVITVSTGAIMSLNSNSQVIGSLSDAGALTFGTGANLTLSTGSSLLSGTMTGTGTITLDAGSTLTLGANFSDSGLNIVLAGGQLKLNGTTDTFGSLSVTSSSILDFANPATSALTVSGVTTSAGATLTVNNWANMVDYFYSNTNPGTALAQISFTGYANQPHWNTYTSGPGAGYEITPAPEPSTYGAIFVGISLIGIVIYRRRRPAA
jgi:autotransporter-associated beta strand protein